MKRWFANIYFRLALYVVLAAVGGFFLHQYIQNEFPVSAVPQQTYAQVSTGLPYAVAESDETNNSTVPASALPQSLALTLTHNSSTGFAVESISVFSDTDPIDSGYTNAYEARINSNPPAVRTFRVDHTVSTEIFSDTGISQTSSNVDTIPILLTLPYTSTATTVDIYNQTSGRKEYSINLADYLTVPDSILNPFDFSLSDIPDTTVQVGGSGNVSVTLTGPSSTVSPVTVNAIDTTAGADQAVTITAPSTPTTPTASGVPVALTVTATAQTATGPHTILVYGTGGNQSHQTTFTVTVNTAPPPPPPTTYSFDLDRPLLTDGVGSSRSNLSEGTSGLGNTLTANFTSTNPNPEGVRISFTPIDQPPSDKSAITFTTPVVVTSRATDSTMGNVSFQLFVPANSAGPHTIRISASATGVPPQTVETTVTVVSNTSTPTISTLSLSAVSILQGSPVTIRAIARDRQLAIISGEYTVSDMSSNARTCPSAPANPPANGSGTPMIPSYVVDGDNLQKNIQAAFTPRTAGKKCMWIHASNSAGNWSAYAPTTVLTVTPATAVPAQGFTGRWEGGQIVLQWTHPTSDVAGKRFLVYRRTTPILGGFYNGVFVPITDASSYSLIDRAGIFTGGFSTTTPYYYWVFTDALGDGSHNSSAVTVTVPAVPPPPFFSSIRPRKDPNGTSIFVDCSAYFSTSHQQVKAYTLNPGGTGVPRACDYLSGDGRATLLFACYGAAQTSIYNQPRKFVCEKITDATQQITKRVSRCDQVARGAACPIAP